MTLIALKGNMRCNELTDTPIEEGSDILVLVLLFFRLAFVVQSERPTIVTWRHVNARKEDILSSESHAD